MDKWHFYYDYYLFSVTKCFFSLVSMVCIFLTHVYFQRTDCLKKNCVLCFSILILSLPPFTKDRYEDTNLVCEVLIITWMYFEILSLNVLAVYYKVYHKTQYFASCTFVV